MNRLPKAAVLLALIGNLRKKGSWCGETHIQKATYFLQELAQVPLDFGFILYKHGPFSFDLRDEITALRADGLLVIEPEEPYGPHFAITDLGRQFRDRFPKTIAGFQNQLDFVCDAIAPQGVADLERLATALYVTLHSKPRTSLLKRAKALCKAKPHISPSAAEEALRDCSKLRIRARALLARSPR